MPKVAKRSKLEQSNHPLPKSSPHEALRKEIKRAADARVCIAQNHGYDKELAREGYEHAASELSVAIEGAWEEHMGDLSPQSIEKIAKVVAAEIEKI